MYIGLFDQDLLLYPNIFIPSLELMKYSFYYKKEKNIVKMFYDANESSPYDKIILNSNFNNRENFPKIMVLNPKVEWVGKTFFGGQYHRLPKEVEICEGDKSIYQSFFDKNKNHFRTNQLIRINRFLKNGSPYRLTHKGEIIFDCDKLKNSNKKLYLYDEEIFENQEIFDILSKYKNEKEIIFLESQRVEDFDLFIKINQDLPKIHSWKDRPSIVYEGNLDFKTFIKNYQIFNHIFCLGIPNNYNSEPIFYFAREQLIEKANYFFYALSKDKKIFLVPNQTLSKDNDMVKLLNHFCSFTRLAGKTSDFNFYDFLNKRNKNALPIANEYGRLDRALNKIFKANLNTIHNIGVWAI